MSTNTLRTAAITGAVIFIAGGALELAHKQADHFKNAADYGIEAALALGMLGALAGLLGLHLTQEARLGGVATWMFRIAATGQGLLALCALATLARGEDALGPLFLLGVLAYVVGTIGYAVATSRAAVAPRWVGPVLAVGTIVGIAVNPGGTIVIGAAWLLIATSLLGTRTALRPAVS